jgi:hypothetical protein
MRFKSYTVPPPPRRKKFPGGLALLGIIGVGGYFLLTRK